MVLRLRSGEGSFGALRVASLTVNDWLEQSVCQEKKVRNVCNTPGHSPERLKRKASRQESFKSKEK